MTITTVFAPITKTVEQDDGSVLVYGKATDGSLDGDMQRCDPAWLATAMPTWYQTGGNVREQHDPHRAVGKAVDHEATDDGSHYVTARIVDPVSVLKTKAGIFTGFSIGISRPKVSKSADAPNGIIDGGTIVELSLCDRPSNPGCLITLAKAAKPGMEVNAADFDSDRLLVRCEELIEKTGAPDDTHPAGTDDTSMTVTLADALPADQVEKLNSKIEINGGGGNAAARMAEIAKATAARAADTAGAAPDTNGTVQKLADTPPPAELPTPTDPPADPPAPDTAVDKTVETTDTPQVTDPQPVDTPVDKAAEGDPDAPAAVADPTPTPPVVAATPADAVKGLMTLNEARVAAGLPAVFDPDAAKALVATIIARVDAARTGDTVEVAKVDGGDGAAGIDDEIMASVAISLIARLIQSEAADMVNNPDEDCDIRCLLEAVSALRWFIRRERAEGGAGGATDSAPYYGYYSASPDPVPVAKTADPAGGEAAPVDPPADKAASTETPDVTPDPVATKTAAPDAAKATEVSEPDDNTAAIVKAVTAALSKSDSPLTTMFESIVQASTEATVKSVSDLTERLAQVEQMAIPGGPAVRRTEVEKARARVQDLASEVRRFQALADHTADHDLRQGYAAKVATLETELRALTH